MHAHIRIRIFCFPDVIWVWSCFALVAAFLFLFLFLFQHRSMHSSVDKAISYMEESNRTFAQMSYLGLGRWALGNQLETLKQCYPLDRLPLLKASKGTAKHFLAIADEVEATAEIEVCCPFAFCFLITHINETLRSLLQEMLLASHDR